jgi:transcriptional regulator with XRE-family HTH domain
MTYGEKLKNLREHYGYSQRELALKIGINQANISFWEKADYPSLDGITKVCEFLKIPIYEFFIENENQLKNTLPDYITPSDAAVLKILNTAIDIKTRVEIKKVFIHTMKVALMQYKDKLQHMPEFKKIFGDEGEKKD